MRKKIIRIGILVFFQSRLLNAQSPTHFTIKTSADFDNPSGHVLLNPIDYGEDGLIQVSSDELKSFCFQRFSKDLQLQKENTVSTKDKFNEKNRFEKIITTKNKSYLLTREVRNDDHTEGVSALEFFPDRLDFASKSISLFQSTDRVAINKGTYRYDLSQDKTKMMFSYRLVPKIKSDVINKATIGLYVYDENLRQIWGRECEMPYTERVMDILDYTVSNDEKIFMTVRVFENQDQELMTKDGKPAFHYELLVFKNNASGPLTYKINLNNYFPNEAYVFEDGNKNIIVAGLYSKRGDKAYDGTYMVKRKMEEPEAGFSETSGQTLVAGIYELPPEVILSGTGGKEKGDSNKDLSVDRLYTNRIYATENGSVKILTEVYRTKSNTLYNKQNNVVDTYVGDIYIFSIADNGKLAWLKKIPKAQHRPDGDGRALSFNSIAVENDLHLFYLDTEENNDLLPGQKPSVYNGRREGYLRGIVVDENGSISRYTLDYKKIKSIDFFISYFIHGNRNNLIYVERTAKKNVLFSIEPQ